MSTVIPTIDDIEKKKYDAIFLSVGQFFKPTTPVSEKDLFSGRVHQISRVLDVIYQEGQHAIIFGERGVGKTSLANVLSSFAQVQQGSIISVRINCDKQDDFNSVWVKVFDEMNLIVTKKSVGFQPQSQQVRMSASDLFSGTITPESVRKNLTAISFNFLPILIIDEFDRLNLSERRLFSDLIKSLSDHSLSATIVLIGVGDSIEQLIQEHQSVTRALVQVQMPRMNINEIKEILLKGFKSLGMEITSEALQQICLLAQGLPHYAHLIGLHASRDALSNYSLNIDRANVEHAITKALEDAQHSIKTVYHRAISSSRKDSLFPEVLLSCALANSNELGEFSAQDVRTEMQKITGKPYGISAFGQHLNDFANEKRGGVLIKTGQKRRFKYRFNDPLMQPYIIMQGLKNNRITSDYLANRST